MDDSDLAALLAAHDAERAKLADLIVVSAAEGVVADAHLADLSGRQHTARRRLAAARGWVTRATNAGDPARLVAAREHLADMDWEYDKVSDRVLRETLHLTGVRLDDTGRLLDQMQVADRAWTAALNVMAGKPEKGRQQ